MSKGPRRVVVVGGSAAGLSAAETLRRRGFAGEIVVIEREADAGYERPPLSKQVLRGEAPPAGRLLDRTNRLGIEIRRGVSATALDVAGRLVTLSDGTTLGYGDLVIATGVVPRRLPQSDVAGVHVLRTRADAARLRADLTRSRSLVVLGAGFLGMEVAASARRLGVEVTVVDVLDNPLDARIGAAAAGQLRDRHRAEGVRFLTAVVAGFVREASAARVAAVALSDGTVLPADCVLMAVGSQPAVEWLQGSGLDLRDGVVCDQWCRAAPGVWAAGDVARWRHPATGASMRIEHRTNATEQAVAVARNILGDAVPFAPVPYIWTDQYDVRIQLAGIAPPGVAAERTEGGGSGTDSFTVVFRAGARVVGVLAWNAAKALAALRRQIDLGPYGMRAPPADRQNVLAQNAQLL
jgi:NADPH-dependent 2,4-dienoyl-CoA reductase/sulfur reductase-like enzyme